MIVTTTLSLIIIVAIIGIVVNLDNAANDVPGGRLANLIFSLVLITAIVVLLMKQS